MQFEATMIQELPLQEGVSKSGNPWKKKEWVFETGSESGYPRKVKVQCFGDRSDNFTFIPGKRYVLDVDLESREFNGRWYTDVSVFRAQESMAPQGGMQPGGMAAAGGYQQAAAPQPFGAPQQPAQNPIGAGAPSETDDLPF